MTSNAQDSDPISMQDVPVNETSDHESEASGSLEKPRKVDGRKGPRSAAQLENIKKAQAALKAKRELVRMAKELEKDKAKEARLEARREKERKYLEMAKSIQAKKKEAESDSEDDSPPEQVRVDVESSDEEEEVVYVPVKRAPRKSASTPSLVKRRAPKTKPTTVSRSESPPAPKYTLSFV
jgi:hypothetical protein